MSTPTGVPGAVAHTPETTAQQDLMKSGTWDLSHYQRLRMLYEVGGDGWVNLPYQAHTETLDAIAASGLRIDTLEHVWYRDPKRDPHGLIAARYVQGERAVFIYEPFFYHSAKDRQLAAAHEVGHHNSVFDDANAYIFGGEDEQEQAMDTVAAIAEQALESGIYLSAYHELRARKVHANKSSRGEFYEETWAVLCEFASAGRLEELEAIGAEQAEKLRNQWVPMKLSAKGEERNAFTKLFTSGLIYGVHDAVTLASFTAYRRAAMATLDEPGANANLYYAPRHRRMLGWLALKRTPITGL